MSFWISPDQAERLADSIAEAVSQARRSGHTARIQVAQDRVTLKIERHVEGGSE